MCVSEVMCIDQVNNRKSLIVFRILSYNIALYGAILYGKIVLGQHRKRCIFSPCTHFGCLEAQFIY